MNRIVLFAISLLFAACTESPSDDAAGAVQATGVSIMSFNVENLFDNIDDDGKDDATYLPLAAKSDIAHIEACNRIEVARWRNDCLYLDWSAELIDYKLSVIGEAILQVNGGRGPDIVALQEIENLGILERLRTEHLAVAEYGPAILIEGQDRRGIDVAFLTRLPLVGEPVLHALEFPEHPERALDTRGVLEATFELPDGQHLTGFAVHFPAPFHPIEMREHAYDHLNGLLAGLPVDRPAFAAGDFNTARREMEGTPILDERVRPHWTIAHEVGCEGCPGTNYWPTGDTWSFLDMILFSATRSENTTWVLRADSVRLANEIPAQVKPDGTPRRFSRDPLDGVSDHWPLVAEIEPAKNNGL